MCSPAAPNTASHAQCADCGGIECDKTASEFNGDLVCEDCEHDRVLAHDHSLRGKVAGCGCDFCDESVPAPAWL